MLDTSVSCWVAMPDDVDALRLISSQLSNKLQELARAAKASSPANTVQFLLSYID